MSTYLKIPQIGAQVWIEPGQTREEIYRWFRILADHRMPCARLFLMWNYIEIKPGDWDFSLYDFAFDAAKKYGIRIQATLTPNHGPAHRGKEFWYLSQGEVILADRRQLKPAESYIEKTVGKYRSHPALEYWWLQNEPGQAPANDPLAIERFIKWLQDRYDSVSSLNKLWITDFSSFDKIEYHPSWDGGRGWHSPQPYYDWHNFWRDHLTWYLNWIAEQIRKTDSQHPIHVNPHAVFDMLPRYDLPAWRSFLDSLGASIHPSWHFGLLEREQYPLGVSATCQIIKGAIEPRPFWISELQGGNNIFSSRRPLYPSPEDISRWVWTGIGSGVEKILFWCLNSRKAGNEAGEWSMLDYRGDPSERLEEAGRIISVLNENKDSFSGANPVIAPVAIILSPETMLLQSRLDFYKDIPGRMANAHMQSSLAFYEAISELGMSAQIKLAGDFNWNETGTGPRAAILANMTCIPDDLVPKLKAFIQNKNKLIITGLTGYFDEKENNLIQQKFPLKELTGGTIKEIRLADNIFYYKLNGLREKLPVHMWEAEILNMTGKVEGKQDGRIIALRNRVKGGEVLWIPSMIGLGAWLSDNGPLAALLQRELSHFTGKTFAFAEHVPGVFMKILKSGPDFIIILINGQKKEASLTINGADHKILKLLYGEKKWLKKGRINLGSRGIMVFKYRQRDF
jgi:beta-galactosidase